jgi:targeting protein for Xklp2
MCVLYVTCLQRDEKLEKEAIEEVARLRKQSVHKANPVRRYKPTHVLGSDKLLTDPHSPSFMSRKRADSK